MSPARGTARRWGRTSSWDVFPTLEDESPRDSNDGRVVDFFLFAVLPMAYFQVHGLPASELAAGLAVGLALLRKPRVRSTPWLTWTLLGLLGLMLLSAQLNGASIDPGRRLLHITLYVALALTAAQGRFHTRSMAKGLAVGLLVSAGAYYVGYGTGYPGRLAGLMADPNSAGYLLTHARLPRPGGAPGRRRPHSAGPDPARRVVLTYSRTSILAVALIVAVGHHRSSARGVPRRAAAGRDDLGRHQHPRDVADPRPLRGPQRQRRPAPPHRQARAAADLGSSRGTATAPAPAGSTSKASSFFFHNSYLSLHNEGGRVGSTAARGGRCRGAGGAAQSSP